MKNTFYFLCLFLVFGGRLAHGAEANYLFYFEDNQDLKKLTNSGSAQNPMLYTAPSHQTADQAKFGKGSLAIVETLGAKGEHYSGGFVCGIPSFSGEIHKMTITTWLRRPSSEGEINIFMRMPAEAPGGFSFQYSAYSKNLGLRVAGPGGKADLINSEPINCFFADEWIHFGVTFDEGKIIFYVNGLPVGGGDMAAHGIKTIPASAPATTQFNAFFGLQTGSYVDDFGFFTDRVLTAEEMDFLYSNGLEELVKKSVLPKP
ncbi:MAG: LamG domain-containing protein [Chthoniobacterales bacterium]